MAKIFKLLLILVLTVFITSCAAKRMKLDTLSFPADLDQPFLTLVHILGEENVSAEGFFQGLMLKISGPRVLSPLARPIAVAVDGNGDVYVVDADAAKVLRYRYKNGKLVTVEPLGTGLFMAPQGIAISKDVIYVSDAGTGLIHRFNRNFKSLGTLQVQELQRPGQLRINPQTGELFVVDTPAHQVFVIDAQGQVKARLDKGGIGKSVLKAPLALDFTPEGHVAVLDGLTRRVEFFSSDYQHLSGFGGYDQVPGSFSYPRGLAVSSDGFVFVSDAAFGNVQIFDPNGALLYYWGETGKEAGEFLLPAALTFDAQDNLFVVDQYNNRVQVYHYYAQER